MSLAQTPAAVLPVMVGTAGHVDHGKTALVQLLTGCELDRIPESKARGLTIDLGFAPCRLPGNRLVGIVDVPGHEDFIRNMVAGAASIDVLMLIVAADDGIMPQTREHLMIVKLLRTPRVMVVVTKIDLVEAEMREIVQEDVRAFMAENGFPDAPIVLASNITFDGINTVRRTLQALVEEVERPPDPRAFRMNVERVFSVKGYGTVVTGIPTTGRVPAGETLALLPAGSQHMVRAVQTYKQAADHAVSGACAAINLRDLEIAGVERGQVVATPGLFRSTTGILAHLQNAHAALPLKRLAQVRFHAGTAVSNASTKLIAGDALLPGQAGFVHIRFEQPLVLAAGDHYVLRCLSPVTTLGGGVVLSARDYKLKRSCEHLQPRLTAALEAVRAGDWLLGEILAGPSPVLDTAELLRLTQCMDCEAQALISAREASGELIRLGNDGWLAHARLPEIFETMAKTLARYHAAHPYQWGMDSTLACRTFALPGTAFKSLAKCLTAQDRFLIQHGRLALAEFAPALSVQQMRWREAILARAEKDGVNAPARGTLMKELGIPEKEMRLLLRLLGEEGAISLVGANILLTTVLRDCRQKLLDLFAAKDIVEIGDFRRVTGASRNLAVALLDQFDADGLTRRVPEGRVLARTQSEGRGPCAS